ncbi:MAG: tetratricopeptide repeat protein [FCB group bacterium]|nr:tetratricopeptide repeat protein [FCB group bacterium]
MIHTLGKFWLVTAFLVTGLLAQSSESFLEAGMEKFNQKDWASAESLFKKAIEADDSNHKAYFQLGLVQFRMGDMENAKTNLKQAIEMEPEAKDYREQYDLLRDVISRMSDGVRSMNNGAYDEAFTIYQKVLETAPEFAEAAYSMGLAKFKLKDFDSAVDYFKKAIEINPAHENAKAAIANVAKNTFNAGNNAYRRGDLESALNNYRRVLAIDPEFYQAQYQIGVIEAKMRNYTDAIDAYTKALDIKPEFYKGWYALGLAQKYNGNFEAAIEAYQKAIDVNSGYSKAYVAIGTIYLDQKDYDKAIHILEQATQVDASYAPAYAALGKIYVEQEDYMKAISNLELAVSFRDRDYKSWYHLAVSYNHIQDCEKAKEAARKSTTLKKSFGGGWLELGVAEYCGGQGNKTAALNDLEQARGDRDWRKMAEYEMDKIKNPAKYQD